MIFPPFHQEKKRTRKALELKRSAEFKLDSLHERISKLQLEVGTLRAHLKSYKTKVRELELNESQVPSLRAEFDREQTTLQTEVSHLRKQVSVSILLYLSPRWTASGSGKQ